ncbi:MAG: phytanoyl-CoA dioxygenase family protein [Ardenticatenaceae bacterium]|nr:phytanoyl-CoA dioxygenase family protein [Ardenticatenaceae bacterium]
MIGAADKVFFAEHGYLIVEEALSQTEVAALHRETVQICRGKLGTVNGLPDFNPAESDDEVIRRTLCIHHPHKISELILEVMRHPAIVDVLTGVVSPNVKCMQSMLFIKSAGKPGQAWHQDEDFIPTRDRSLIGAWIALDDATVSNGCLWVIPGSHRDGILWELAEQDNPDFDCTDEAVGFPYTADDAVPVELKAGSVVFFNGYLLHRSLPNVTTTGYRRALVFHYMNAASLLPWRPREGVSPSVLDFRDIVMVAGQDPYGYKGTENIFAPHIRPSGEGGCKWPTRTDQDTNHLAAKPLPTEELI